jgi:hypothetical protein
MLPTHFTWCWWFCDVRVKTVAVNTQTICRALNELQGRFVALFTRQPNGGTQTKSDDARTMLCACQTLVTRNMATIDAGSMSN